MNDIDDLKFLLIRRELSFILKFQIH